LSAQAASLKIAQAQEQLGQGQLQKRLGTNYAESLQCSGICSNSEFHTGTPPSVRFGVGPELTRCVFYHTLDYDGKGIGGARTSSEDC
jgi:hypothetical protein